MFKKPNLLILLMIFIVSCSGDSDKLSDNDSNSVNENIVINENDLNSSISIYPNPVKDHFIVSTSGTVSIFDVSGKMVRNVFVEAGDEVLVNELNSGIYFVKLNWFKRLFDNLTYVSNVNVKLNLYPLFYPSLKYQNKMYYQHL